MVSYHDAILHFSVAKIVISQILSTYHLCTLFGVTWKILIGCVPFLAKFLVFKKHNQRMNDLATQMATTQENNTEKPLIVNEQNETRHTENEITQTDVPIGRADRIRTYPPLPKITY